MYREDVNDSAHTWTVTDKGELCLWVLAKLNAFVHGSDDINFCQELTCDAAPWSHRDFERDVAADCCVDGGQCADFADFFQSEGVVSRSEM